MKPKLVIWGTSAHASLVVEIIRSRGQYEIVGFLDDVNPERHGKEFCRAPILGGREQLDRLQQWGVHHLIFGFGNCAERLRLSELVRQKGYRLAKAIHPQAVVASDVPIGPGTVIRAGAVIDPGVKIKANVIVSASTLIAHGSLLGEGTLISGGVTVGGNVTVGRSTWIGLGAVIKDHVRIGEHCVIGAGAVVLGDIPNGVVAYGVPAKIIRRVDINDCVGMKRDYGEFGNGVDRLRRSP